MKQVWMFHQPYEPYAYALSDTVARVVVAVERGTAEAVVVHFGDRYVDMPTEHLTMDRAGSAANLEYFSADVTIPTHRLKYAFQVLLKARRSSAEGNGDTQEAKSLWYGETGVSEDARTAGVFQLAYLCQRDIFETPAWAEHAVCYQIFPERFANGNPELTPEDSVPWDSKPTPFAMFGGDLPGITSRLDYLADQGVTLIYLTPIFKAGSNHKYDTQDYMEIDPQFGTKEDLRNLVQSAHQRGIRIVLDAVFNHSGFYFAPFQDAVKNGKGSAYWNWFFIDGEEVDTENVNYESFATKLKYMPKLHVAHPEVEAYLLQVAEYWIKEFDIDGWRLDVANEIDHVFWKHFRDTVKTAKSDALIVGEVWHNSLPWLRGDEFDSVMNYVFREAVHAFFIRRQISASEFSERITECLFMYPTQATKAMFNLLGSHDTERVLTLAEGDVARVLQAMAFQFIYPGIPMVYYGDEIGMEGGADPDCRRGMVWDEEAQNHDLREAMKVLAALKKNEPALGEGELRVLRADKQGLEYVRVLEGAPTIHAAFNTGRTGWRLDDVGEVLFSSKQDAVAKGKLAPGTVVVWRS
ncbi:glycoside hydrolase family 13 protein [Alicyclobacillus ferrooxydans]|uniref:glycoside hydrolase family 13 protein n=1 Tax=Alicyclobacillus ferrooxydans TaxID=471514 RepID=UPI0006D54FB6|nr:glycoside hydrolase family 13 protein [Alicyclobacillus ferrooxydans]